MMSMKITSATAVAGFHNHKHSCWSGKLAYAFFAAFEEEYLVSLNACQSADWWHAQHSFASMQSKHLAG